MPIPAVPTMPCRKCGKRLRAGGTAANEWFPFCSEGCCNADLGSWIDERYRVASADTEATTDPTVGMPDVDPA